MSGGFTKLYSGIVHSTVWREPNHVRIVWITMLALADRNGEVSVLLPGLADAAHVSIEECTEALDRLSTPDPYSRTKDHEGRRIAAIDGGWHVLNYAKYRAVRHSEDRRLATREYVRRYRERRDAEVIPIGRVSRGKPMQKEIADVDPTTTPPEDQPGLRDAFADFWSAYPSRGGASNPQRDARSLFELRVSEGVVPAVMIAEAARYAEWCAILGRTKSPYVMQAVRWLGDEERGWEGDRWAIGWHLLKFARDDGDRAAIAVALQEWQGVQDRQEGAA